MTARQKIPHHHQRRLYADRIAALYQQEPHALFGHLLANYLAAIYLSQFFGPWLVIAWAAAMTVACGLRAGFAWHFGNRGDRPATQTDLLRHSIGTLACSLVWSVGSVTLLPLADGPTRAFLMMILAGITAAAVVTLSPHLKSYLAFVAGMVVIPITWLCFSSDPFDNAMGGLGILYANFCIFSARRAGKTLTRGFVHYYRNEEMVKDLAEAKSVAESARKKAERLAKTKQEFLANMSHEIRTPMNGVLGMAELLQASPLNNEQRTWTATLQRSGCELLNLLDDILDLSKIEAGKLNLDPAPFNLSTFLDDIGTLHAATAAKKKVGFTLDVPLNLPLKVFGDAMRIRQILHNLVGNAVKFTSQGEIVLSARLNGSGKNSRLRLRVRDQGIGIAKNRQAAIFEPFTQADGSTTRKFGGTGLGLAITKRLVQKMKGTISLASKPNHGSCFEVEIPLPTLKQTAPLKGEGITVLLFENSAVTNAIVTRIPKQSLDIRTLKLAAGFPLLAQNLAGLCGQKNLIVSSTILQDEVAGQRIADAAAKYFWRVWECTPPNQAKSAHGSFRLLPMPMTCRSLRNIFYPQVFPSQRFQIPLDKTLETRNILVADDNAVNAQLAKKMLEKLGQRVRLATNGPELLKLFAQQGADLILMDIQMPLLDGFETTRRLRRTAQGKKVPVLALTAHSLEEERIRCLKAGMDGVLTKPLGFRELIQALKNAENRGKRAG